MRSARTADGTLSEVRVGSHRGYDRLVLEFREGLPGYEIRYAEESLEQCGSGRPVRVTAPEALSIRLSPAAAHDERGGTLSTRALQPGHDVLRSGRVICDFEGVVEWVVEAGRQAPFRVLELQDPARLVVDLRTGTGGR